MRQPTAETFLKDVANHRMTVMLDSDIHRHLHFSQPGTSNMYFDIVTWPGSLVIGGDMGTWVFSRVSDMLTFFRDDVLRINPHYWSEKCQNGTSGGRDEGKEFDEETFGKDLIGSLAGCSFDEHQLAEITEAVRDEVLCHDNQWELMVAARDFTHTFSSGQPDKFSFDSCELPDGMVYCYHFIWCLYAIVWGIQQWDTHGPRPRPIGEPCESR